MPQARDNVFGFLVFSAFLPKPLLRAEFYPAEFQNTVAEVLRILSLESSFAKPSPHLNSASFSPQGETRPRLATTIPKKQKGNSRQNKIRMRGGERGRVRHSRSRETLLPQCLGAEAVAWRNSLVHQIFKFY